MSPARAWPAFWKILATHVSRHISQQNRDVPIAPTPSPSPSPSSPVLPQATKHPPTLVQGRKSHRTRWPFSSGGPSRSRAPSPKSYRKPLRHETPSAASRRKQHNSNPSSSKRRHSETRLHRSSRMSSDKHSANPARGDTRLRRHRTHSRKAISPSACCTAAQSLEERCLPSTWSSTAKQEKMEECHHLREVI